MSETPHRSTVAQRLTAALTALCALTLAACLFFIAYIALSVAPTFMEAAPREDISAYVGSAYCQQYGTFVLDQHEAGRTLKQIDATWDVLTKQVPNAPKHPTSKLCGTPRAIIDAATK